MHPEEFLKKHGFDKAEEEREHTLEENARDHAKHLRRPNAGTPHDWEDWERCEEELKKNNGSLDESPVEK